MTQQFMETNLNFKRWSFELGKEFLKINDNYIISVAYKKELWSINQQN